MANLLIAGLVGAAVVFLFAAQDWQRAIKLALVLVVVEGALRKWVLPQASELIYFLKDIVLLGAYVSYYHSHVGRQRKPAQKTIFQPFLVLMTLWCVAEVFNPRLGSPVVGVFGLKSYLFYIPLVWILPNLFTTWEKLYHFLRAYLLLIIPIGILGIVQYFSPPTSFLNVYVPGEVTSIAAFNGHVRITGTFSYIGGYGVYLLVAFGLLLPLLTLRQSWMWRVILLVELFLIVVNSFMSGSRGVILNQALLLLLYLAFLFVRQPGETIRFVRRFTLPAVVVGYIVFTRFRIAFDNFMLRVTVNDDLSSRVSSSFANPFDFIDYAGIMGYGIGATLPGGRALRTILGLPVGEWIPVYFESEMGRIILEIGPLGFLGWYLLRLIIMLALFSVFWRLRTPLLRQLALIAFLIHLLLFNGQLVVNQTFAVYYWVLASFTFLLPRLEQAYTPAARKFTPKPYHVKTTNRPYPSYR
ncbi:MAG: hypothetical protein H6631_17290 [Anaerolineaceae bacterium]|nr:hypothetical protein [Anaerolineaceae bacterium]